MIQRVSDPFDDLVMDSNKSLKSIYTKIPLTWIEGAGHNSNTDKPEQVNRLIEEFVADIL